MRNRNFDHITHRAKSRLNKTFLHCDIPHRRRRVAHSIVFSRRRQYGWFYLVWLFLRLIRITVPNGIWVCSAVMYGSPCVHCPTHTDEHTDRHTTLRRDGCSNRPQLARSCSAVWWYKCGLKDLCEILLRARKTWLGSRVVSVLDSGAEGIGFKSQPRRCWLGKLFTPIVPLFTKHRNW